SRPIRYPIDAEPVVPPGRGSTRLKHGAVPSSTVNCPFDLFRTSRADERHPAPIRIVPMNTQEAKIVIEAALLCAQQPMSIAELRRLFDEEVAADKVRALLDELRQRSEERRVG